MTHNSTQRRVALVTGGASGIGQAMAVALADGGMDIGVIDLAAADETVARVTQAGRRACSVKADVSSAVDWQLSFDAIANALGGIDVLVNAAGILPFVEFADLDYETWKQIFRINLDSAFLGSKLVVPGMIERGWGRIISVSSSTYMGEGTGMTHYIASKMGMIGLTRGLSNELGKFGITVNAISPGIVDTPATQIFPAEIKAALWERQPIARFARPDDIAGTAVFLASDAAAMLTGQTIMVTGGLYKL